MAQRSGSVVQTFLFADLSGFTALTEAHGDEQAADLVGGFCGTVRQLLDQHRAQEVKTIGDALMLRSADAAAAIRLGLCIVHDMEGVPVVAARRLPSMLGQLPAVLGPERVADLANQARVRFHPAV